MPRSIGVEAGFPRGEEDLCQSWEGEGMGGGQGRSRTARTATPGRNAPFHASFWGRQIGMDALQEEDTWYGGSCLSVGGSKGNPRSREAGTAH